MTRRAWISLGLALATPSCAPPHDEARAAFLRDSLVLDNQLFLERDPELAGGKLAKMGEGLFPFFRGTLGVFARDAMEPGGPSAQRSAFLDASARDVALVGDPHPENLGSFRTGAGVITIDFNDFDAATYGPWILDVRRLALGHWAACRHARNVLAELGSSALSDDDCTTAARASTEGYAAEIAAVAADPSAATRLTLDAPGGAIALALLEDAVDDGDSGQKLAQYTVIEAGARRMFIGDLDPAHVAAFGEHEQLVLVDSVRDPSAGERAWVEQIVAGWASSVLDAELVADGATTILGVSRRFGAGVASYPSLRWYVLLAGASASLDDDVLLEVKEVLDAMPLPGLARLPDAPFIDNGTRVVALARDLQGFRDDDPWLGWARTGPQSFRVRELTGYQGGFDVADSVAELAGGGWSPDDLITWARDSGRVLARGHALAPELDGGDAAAHIAEAIDADEAGLVAEVDAWLTGYAAVLAADFELFGDLLAEHGPNLGYARR